MDIWGGLTLLSTRGLFANAGQFLVADPLLIIHCSGSQGGSSPAFATAPRILSSARGRPRRFAQTPMDWRKLSASSPKGGVFHSLTPRCGYCTDIVRGYLLPPPRLRPAFDYQPRLFELART
jgi:hypothetical protein